MRLRCGRGATCVYGMSEVWYAWPGVVRGWRVVAGKKYTVHHGWRGIAQRSAQYVVRATDCVCNSIRKASDRSHFKLLK